jgi:hypothetical protein
MKELRVKPEFPSAFAMHSASGTYALLLGDRDIRPAAGFFNLARDQGYDLPAKETEDIFWARQLEKVYDEHSRRRRFRRRRR